MKAFFAKVLDFLRSLGCTIAAFVRERSKRSKIHVSVDSDGDGEYDSEVDIHIEKS